jgi:uncharacterized paraquat-inducible protein A
MSRRFRQRQALRQAKLTLLIGMAMLVTPILTAVAVLWIIRAWQLTDNPGMVLIYPFGCSLLVGVAGVFVAAAAGLRCFYIRRQLEPPKRRPASALRCAKCGYLLYGLPEPRCPECGTPFDRES